MSAKADAKANGSAGGFRTDTAISSGRPGGERTLQRWMPDDAPSDMESSLEQTSSGRPWNQFEENERRFGLTSDYNENMYTTAINKNHPQYQARLAAADKKAREIERSAPVTSHVAEERVMDYVGGDDHGADEEDKYSGVKRQAQQDFPPLPTSRENKYTPPARRAPTGSATVTGAPVDPAIISSQLKAQKPQPATKVEDSKARTTPAPETSAPLASAAKTAGSKQDAKPEGQSKVPETKPGNQTATPLRAAATTSRTISPQNKEGTAPSATSTVERDVLKEFKTFANQQRVNAEKIRSSKAKADKEVKLIELKKFADSFKLPTPVPMDLISIIAKDPAKQKEIQAKAQRDAAELARRKEEAAAKEKKPAAATTATNKDGQSVVATAQASNAERARPVGNTANVQPTNVAARHPGNRQSFNPAYAQFRNDRSAPQHVGQSGRQTGNLAARIRNGENQRGNQEMRQPPTGPANAPDAPYPRRMGGMPSHMGAKLNPNSHEFRPSPYAAAFSPNGHPSAGSSPRSAANNAAEGQAGAQTAPVVITKKRKAVDPNKCSILRSLKHAPVPPGKNYDDNEGIKPSYDTPPVWRQQADDEKAGSTMSLSLAEYFERQPFSSTQPTPNVTHSMPHMAHQHQLPFHLQQGAHNVGPRQSPHVPAIQMHPGQHGPVPHPYNGADDHRMMHSNSAQSFSSPRMNQVPIAYPPNVNAPVQAYGQNVMQPFMPGTPQMNHFNRSFSNNPQFMPQQQIPMGSPMMMQPQYISPQGMPGPQMAMYPPGHQFIPPGAAAPQPMPGANGYPSPGRPAPAPMMHQGSQQGQPIYGMSPGVQYQQPVFPQQQGQMPNMRGYSNPPGPQQFGTSPQHMHQYAPQQHRNNSNNYNKNYQGHNQHHGPQSGHSIPSGPQGRSDGPDEAK